MNRRRVVIGAGTWIVVLMAALILTAQVGATDRASENTGALKERVEVSLVLLDAVATDTRGNPVTDLASTEFDLIVDNERVPIESVETKCTGRTSRADWTDTGSSTGDRYFIILFDFSHLMAASRRNAINSALRFVDEKMTPDDHVMVLGFLKGLHVITRTTRDRGVLRKTLASMLDDSTLIDPTPFEEHVNLERLRYEWGRRAMEARGRARASGGILSFTEAFGSGLDFECEGDARQAEMETARALRALASAMPALTSVPGRKALIFFTETLRSNPGLPYYEACRIPLLERPSLGLTVQPELDDLALQANLSGVSFYPVHAGGMTPLGSVDGHQSAIDFETDMALSTGGRNSILMKNTLRPFEEATQDLSCYYVVFYRPPDDLQPGSHHVRLRSTRKGVRVRHREFFTVQTRAQASESQMLAAMTSPGLYHELPVELHGYSLAEVASGKRQFLLKASVPLSDLIHLPAALMKGMSHAVGFRGAFVHGNTVSCGFNESFPIPPARGGVAETRQVGVEALCELEPGAYDVVVAARDALAGNLGAVWGKVEVKPPTEGAGPGLLLWSSETTGEWAHSDSNSMAHSPGGNLFIQPSFALRSSEGGALTFLACLLDRGNKAHARGPLHAGVRLEGPTNITLPAQPAVPEQGGECRLLRADIPAGRLQSGIYDVRPEAAPPWRTTDQERRIEVK